MAGKAARAPRLLGFDAHELIEGLWESLGRSAEAQYYSSADWDRVRLELWYGNKLLTGNRAVPGAQSWSAFQAGLQALLVSPAEKRRVGIELQAAVNDPDQEAAVVQLSEYQRTVAN